MTPHPHYPILNNLALPDSAWFTGTGIAAYRQPENKVAWGFVEGVNNKIRVLQRRSYGLSDEENLRLKVPTCILDPI